MFKKIPVTIVIFSCEKLFCMYFVKVRTMLKQKKFEYRFCIAEPCVPFRTFYACVSELIVYIFPNIIT